MTIGELRKAIEQHDDDVLVVVARDPEGNGYSPLAETGMGVYQAETSSQGWVYNVDETDEYDQADVVPAVVLWPLG